MSQTTKPLYILPFLVGNGKRVTAMCASLKLGLGIAFVTICGIMLPTPTPGRVLDVCSLKCVRCARIVEEVCVQSIKCLVGSLFTGY